MTADLQQGRSPLELADNERASRWGCLLVLLSAAFCWLLVGLAAVAIGRMG